MVKNSPNFLKRFFKKNDDTNINNRIQVLEEDQSRLVQYFSSFTFNHPDLIIVFSSGGEIISQNRDDINKLLGYNPKSKADLKSLVPESTQKVLEKAFKDTLKGKTSRHEIKIPDRIGNDIYLLLTFIPIKVGDSAVDGVYLIVDNITEQIAMKESLELQQEHFERAQEVANVASWEYIINEDSLLVSKKFYQLFGLDDTNDLSMNKPFELVHPDDYESTKKIVSESMDKGKSYHTDFRIYHGKTNELKYIRVKADAVWKNQKAYKLVGIVHDITIQKKLENKLRNHIKELEHIYDNLNVGIWMRENLNDKLVFASDGLADILQLPKSTLFEDPDYWKDMILPDHRDEVFQKYQLLREGKSIELHFRLNSSDGTTKWLYEQTVPWIDEDGKISHLFGLVADISSTVEMQEKLKYIAKYDALTGLPNQKSLYDELDILCEQNKPFAMLYLDLDRFNVINDSLGHQIGDKVLKSVASRLLSNLPKDGYLARIGSNDFIIIVKNALEKNDIFTFADQLMHEIEKTLVIDDYELHITTSIGISFYPENINQIGDWVIKKVCAQLREWKNKDFTLRPISINISPIRLLKKGLVDLVQQQLELYQIPAKFLVFEITEGSLLKSDKTVLSTLKDLRKLGIRIAIDDFGTGYSSLQYLQEFEFDIIKIDKSFMENIASDGRETAIVSSVLHLAKGLDLTVVAEGVEEIEQMDFLTQKECEIIQGYLFSKPVPLTEFEKMIKVGFLKPNKNRTTKLKDGEERRKYFRLEFPFSLPGEMTIIEVKKKKVNLGRTEILIDNIGLGGIKFLSSLKLPINADIKYRFQFEIMKESFILDGVLKWKDEYKGDTFFYGVEFQLNLIDEERLAGLMNKMSAFRHLNQEIPDTTFIHEDSYVYLKKNLL